MSGHLDAFFPGFHGKVRLGERSQTLKDHHLERPSTTVESESGVPGARFKRLHLVLRDLDKSGPAKALFLRSLEVSNQAIDHSTLGLALELFH